MPETTTAPTASEVAEAMADLERATDCYCDLLPSQNGGHYGACNAELRPAFEVLRAALAAAPAVPDDAHTETITEWRTVSTRPSGSELVSHWRSEETARAASRIDMDQNPLAGHGCTSSRVESRTVSTSRRESEWKATEPERHRMLPGTHEWPRTPECRCGAVWFRDADACARQLGEKGAQR